MNWLRGQRSDFDVFANDFVQMIRRLHLITNPKGGVGDNVSLAKTAENFLNGHGIESRVLLTERAGHAREIVEGLELRHGDAVCGIGGDGTMNELLNGLMTRQPEARVPLTLLPGGTGNSLLHDLDGLEPMNVLERIVAGSRRSIDLFEVTVGETRRYGFNVIGWGLVSSGNQLAESLRVMGRLRYHIAGLLHILANRKFRGELEIDGATIAGPFTLLAGTNTIYIGEGMKLAPDARLDDGKLDLLYLQDATRLSLFRLFAKLGSGRHIGEPGVKHVQVSRFKLTTDESLPLNLDGELIESGTFEVQVLPGALDLLI